MEIPLRSSISNILLTLLIEFVLIEFIGSILIAKAANAVLHKHLQQKGFASFKKHGRNPRTYATVLRITLLFTFLALELGVDGATQQKTTGKNMKIQNRPYYTNSGCISWIDNRTICEHNSHTFALTDLENGSLDIDEEIAEKCVERINSLDKEDQYVTRVMPDYREVVSNDEHCVEKFYNVVQVLVIQQPNNNMTFNYAYEIERKKKELQNIAEVISTSDMNVIPGQWKCEEVHDASRSSRRSESTDESIRGSIQKNRDLSNMRSSKWNCTGAYQSIVSKKVEFRIREDAKVSSRFQFLVHSNSEWFQFPLESFLDIKAVHTWLRSELKSMELLLWYIYGRPWNNKSVPIDGLDDILFEDADEGYVVLKEDQRYVTTFNSALVFGSFALIMLLLSLVGVSGYINHSADRSNLLDISWWVSAWAQERVRKGRHNSIERQNEFAMPEMLEYSTDITKLVKESKATSKD